MSRLKPIHAIVCASAAASLALASPVQAVAVRKPVDLVICLDTSGSMSALIDSARAKIWDIVNELASASPAPRLRVGLLTYGTPGIAPATEGYIVRQLDLTDDLDTVYARMMALSTSGGDEYVGWVLNDALHTMDWSREAESLKILFVAGNESADQAQSTYDFRQVCKQARARGVFVNSIYAGSQSQGIAEKWHEVALAGGGNFASIDMEQGVIQIPTPQDDLLYQLNIELNATYVPYGARGAAGVLNQLAQDDNAQKMGVQSCASRNAAKGTTLYDNRAWDLIDAMRDAGFKLDAIEPADLPENMRSMTPKERVAYLDGMARARTAVQEKIQQASVARQAFLEKERRNQSGATALHDAILKALREQAASKGFKFKLRVVAEAEPKDGC